MGNALFWITKFFLITAFRAFYKHIVITGIENIPKNKPVILACNHPNSFIDGVIISFISRREVLVLTRGDVFDKKWSNIILRSMNLLPIYRSTDGEAKDKAERNKLTYETCFGLMNKGKMPLIFSEGVSILGLRLNPLKLGTAKMAIDYTKFFNFENDLYIVPCGINYSKPHHSDEIVYLNIGKAIEFKPYFEPIKNQLEKKVLIDITKKISDAISKELIIVKDPSLDLFSSKVIQIVKDKMPTPFFKFVLRDKKYFNTLQKVIQRTQNLSEANPLLFEELRTNVDQYGQTLNIKKIRNIDVKHTNLAILITNIFLLLLFFIPAMIGFILNAPLNIYAKKLAYQKIKKLEFLDSLHLGFELVFGIIYGIIVLIIGLICFGLKGFLLFPAFRFLGMIYLYWKRIYLDTKHTFSWLKLNKNSQEELIQSKKNIENQLFNVKLIA